MHRSVRVLFCIQALLLLFALPVPGEEQGADVRPRPFFRDPAVSAGGTRIAFCYLGDVWTADRDGRNARRLTDHEAYDGRPAFSPVSNEVAFSSNREGAMDVFIVPGDGGVPKRLTHHVADDQVLGFTPKGDSILFLSRRDTRRHQVWAVPVRGGEPSVFLPVPAHHISFSPDGKSLAFTLGAMAWWRRGYRGAGNFDVWIKNLPDGRARKLTSWEGNDSDVLWAADGDLYFLSDRPREGDEPAGQYNPANLWKAKPEKPEEASKATFHRRHAVLFPSRSPDGHWIIYSSLDGGIFLFEVATSKSQKVPLKVLTDIKENQVLRETFTDKASEMAVSPDGKDIAFAVRGDVFVVARKGGEARKIAEGPSREGFPAWSSDGKTLYFVSNRNGNNDIFKVRSDEEGKERLSKARFFKTEAVMASPVREEHPVVSPDGLRLLYIEGLGDLRALSLEEGKELRKPETPGTLVAKGPLIEDPVFSPDSRWIAFAKAEKDWNSEIYVVPAAGGEAVNVTVDPDDDIQPLFGPKGEYLYLASRRGRAERFNIFRLPLTKKIAQKDKEDLEEEEEEEDDEDEDGGKGEGEKGKGEEGKEEEVKGKKGKKEEEKVVVEIDFDEIEDRARQVTSTLGNDTLPVLSDDGKTLFFKSNNLGFAEIWKSASDGSSLERLTRSRRDPEEMVWSKKEKELVYRTGGSIHTLSADGNKKGSVPYRAKMEIDLPTERLQVFFEAWTALKDFFYDPAMHGADWAGCREEYLPWAIGCTQAEDFNAVFSLMLGELNASHLGIYGPGNGREPEKTGFTGMTLCPGPKGKRYEVVSVLKDSPADREESKVRPGEFLAAVNREPVKAGDNLALLFNGTVGRKVDLLLAPSEEAEGERTVVLRPLDPGPVGNLLYEAWVEEKRAKVEELSGGRLGYIHIRWMSQGEFHKFRREYLAKVREKEGLVLDVRDNPGGYIHNELWELLAKRKPVGRFRIRGAGEEVQPDHTWLKPVVLLINERSASDAEIFPWGFRRLGLGKVVGVPTWGGVIGTGGTQLMNGAWLRLPFVGWYTDTGKNLENFGVEPDVRVENHPEDDVKGIDAQLQEAVKIVLEQLAPVKKEEGGKKGG